MTSINLPQIHVIPDQNSHSALFFFGIPASPFPRELIEIHGFSPAPGGTVYRHSGRLFSGERGTPIVLVIRAGPGTIIELTTSERTCVSDVPIRMAIDHDFNVASTAARSSPPITPSITMPGLNNRYAGNTRMSVVDNDLLAIFANRNLPLWLRDVFDTQLEYWKKHHAETYYQFTPWPVVGEEFRRCVRAAPYWALARWKRDLFPSQIAHCMRRSPAGAVAFAAERIPVATRTSLLSRFADEALAHATDRLTDDEILTCAERDPYAVIQQRRKLTPAIRARVLSKAIPMVRMPPECVPPSLESDVLDSIASFPLVWLDRFGSFVTAMEKIASHLSIQPDGAALRELQQRMDPSGREAFFHLIADWI
jgi:hypothetical protein